MILQQLLQNVAVISATHTDIALNNVQFDSRKVQRGDVFVAERGVSVDGHAFISKAVEQGAAAIVCEQSPVPLPDHVALVLVPDSAAALGQIASNFYGNPSHHLSLTGVTGTNGKTTIATLLYELVQKFGHKAGLLSTVCNYVDRCAMPATHTTPDALEINRLLAEMLQVGCTHVFMEVSSHAAAQHRIDGLYFAGGIFTNLTRDHMDYHGTMQNYLNAKKRFFDMLPAGAFALTNLDDKHGMVMLQNTAAFKKTYSIRTMADFTTQIVENTFEGMTLRMNGAEVTLPLVGRFNASNLTAVMGAAQLLGFDMHDVLVHLSSLKPVAGRFEALYAPEGYIAIVDYAHTPDALSNVLATINEIRVGRGTLITVVGCGGNRDHGKRPMMAREAVAYSNRVIFTSDNPRHEDPQAIIDDMLSGLHEPERRDVLVIVDRREAIKTACALAKKGDVVLVAGKGHEDYQIIGDIKHHFDDKEEILKNF